MPSELSRPSVQLWDDDDDDDNNNNNNNSSSSSSSSSNISNMQLGNLLTRSSLTRPEVCLMVSPGSSTFWSSCLVFSVIYYVAFPT